MPSGKVIALALSPSHNFSKSAPAPAPAPASAQSVPSLTLLPNLGVQGDAHCGATVQHRSRLHIRPPPANLRQVHLIHSELFDELRRAPKQQHESETPEGGVAKGRFSNILQSAHKAASGLLIAGAIGIHAPRRISWEGIGGCLLAVGAGTAGAFVLEKSNVLRLLVVLFLVAATGSFGAAEWALEEEIRTRELIALGCAGVALGLFLLSKDAQLAERLAARHRTQRGGSDPREVAVRLLKNTFQRPAWIMALAMVLMAVQMLEAYDRNEKTLGAAMQTFEFLAIGVGALGIILYGLSVKTPRVVLWDLTTVLMIVRARQIDESWSSKALIWSGILSMALGVMEVTFALVDCFDEEPSPGNEKGAGSEDASTYIVKPGDLGENITTHGLDLLSLPQDTLLVFANPGDPKGEIEKPTVRVTGLRNPCPQIDKFAHGLRERCLVRDASSGEIVGRKAGIMGVVVIGGEVMLGADIHVVLPEGELKPLECV